MRLPTLGNLVAGISLRNPAIASDREAGERRWCRLPGCVGMHSLFSRRGSSIETKATTVVRRLAFQGWVLRVHFDWDAPPVRGATTVAGQNLPIWAQPDCAP